MNFHAPRPHHRHRARAHAHITVRVLVGGLLALILGLIVMWLWNAVIPSLLSLHTISYWQSVGLLVLVRILFGGGWGHRGHSFQRLRSRHAWREYEEWWQEVGKQSFQEFSTSHPRQEH